MKSKQTIVKRKGHQEKYDEKKVYASTYAAALNCHYNEKQAETIALKVMKKVNTWARKAGKKKITSEHIRNHILQALADKEVALMYKHHLDLC